MAKAKLSAKQESVLTSFYYGKGRPRRTSWRTMRRLEACGYLVFSHEAVWIGGRPWADHVVTAEGRAYLEARPYFKANEWLWIGCRRPDGTTITECRPCP